MTVESIPAAGQPAANLTKNFVIDVDTHESIESFEVLLPHLDSHWQRYVVEYGMNGTRWEPKPFNPPTGMHPWEDGSCVSLANFTRELLDGEGVDVAIINNAIHQFGAQAGWFEFHTALAHAYNDWVIENWLAPEPRIRGSVNIVPNDPQVAAREIDRIGAHPQIVQVALPVVVDRQYGEPFYHPIYEAAERNGLVIAMHHGAQTKGATGFGRYFVEWHTTGMMQGMMCQLVSMVAHGVFDRFPRLKVVCLEAGFSWMPALMARMDRQYIQFRHETPWVKRKPSEHLRDNVRLATQPIEDISAKHLQYIMEMCGSDEMILFSSDYPHYDGDSLPGALPGGLPEHLREKIFSGNALKTYSRLV